ncbi:MAG: HEAT repeat domain-containing protein [Planctomycetota bacterium]|jgi:HEAT repeat protein
MRRTTLLALLALAISFTPPRTLRADEIVLKNGAVFSGKILKETDTHVVIKTDLGEMSFAKSSIETIRRSRAVQSKEGAKGGVSSAEKDALDFFEAERPDRPERSNRFVFGIYVSGTFTGLERISIQKETRDGEAGYRIDRTSLLGSSPQALRKTVESTLSVNLHFRPLHLERKSFRRGPGGEALLSETLRITVGDEIGITVVERRGETTLREKKPKRLVLGDIGLLPVLRELDFKDGRKYLLNVFDMTWHSVNPVLVARVAPEKTVKTIEGTTVKIPELSLTRYASPTGGRTADIASLRVIGQAQACIAPAGEIHRYVFVDEDGKKLHWIAGEESSLPATLPPGVTDESPSARNPASSSPRAPGPLPSGKPEKLSPKKKLKLECNLKILRDPREHPCAKAGAIFELLHVGAPAVPFIIEALMDRSHSIDVRQAAAEVLGKTGDKRAAGPLVAVLKEKAGSGLDLQSARALRRCGTPEVVPDMIRLIREERPITVGTLIEALGKIGGPRAVDFLIELLRSKSLRLTNSAQSALKFAGAPAVEPLIRLLRSSDGKLARRASLILGEIGDPRALGPLISRLKRGFGDAGFAAGHLGRISLVDLRRCLRHHDPKVRGGAIAGLEVIPGNDAVMDVLECIRDKDSGVRRRASDFLRRKIGGNFHDDYEKWKKWIQKNVR